MKFSYFNLTASGCTEPHLLCMCMFQLFTNKCTIWRSELTAMASSRCLYLSASSIPAPATQQRQGGGWSKRESPKTIPLLHDKKWVSSTTNHMFASVQAVLWVKLSAIVDNSQSFPDCPGPFCLFREHKYANINVEHVWIRGSIISQPCKTQPIQKACSEELQSSGLKLPQAIFVPLELEWKWTILALHKTQSYPRAQTRVPESTPAHANFSLVFSEKWKKK